MICEHVIIKQDRTVTVPESEKKIAIQYDHNVNTITFDCPRYADENPLIDMSTMSIYINYMLADKTLGASLATNVTVDEEDPSLIHFDWVITNTITSVSGLISALICVKQVDADGNELYHWNTELFQKFSVGAGMECVEPVIDMNPDIITQLLLRMDHVEEIATPESMQEYVNDYLNNDDTLQQTILEYVIEYLKNNDPTSYESMQSYINLYLTEHPPLFVIGSEKPGVKCLWFNTGDGSSTSENTTLKISADDVNDTLYVVVEGTEDIQGDEIYLTDELTGTAYELSVNDSKLTITEV